MMNYRKVFFIASLWNLIFSIPAILFPKFGIRLAYGIDAVQPIISNYYALSFYYFMWGSVLLFGIGYYIVSRDILKNQGIILLAIFGKPAFFLYFLCSYIIGRSTFLSLLGGIGDLIFTIIFIMFLMQRYRR